MGNRVTKVTQAMQSRSLLLLHASSLANTYSPVWLQNILRVFLMLPADLALQCQLQWQEELHSSALLPKAHLDNPNASTVPHTSLQKLQLCHPGHQMSVFMLGRTHWAWVSDSPAWLFANRPVFDKKAP